MSHGCRCIIEASCTHAAARSPACCRMSNGCRCSAALVDVVTCTEGVTNRAAQLGVTYCSALSKNLVPCCRRNKVRDMRCLPRSSRNIASRRSWCARESTYRCGLLAPNLPKSGPKVLDRTFNFGTGLSTSRCSTVTCHTSTTGATCTTSTRLSAQASASSRSQNKTQRILLHSFT